jgi:hypothetical protein
MIKRYLLRLYDAIISRGYVDVEYVTVNEQSNQQGTIEGRLNFHDGSMLEFDEAILAHNDEIIKLRYAYHYQDSDNRIIFRYDNAPHHPYITTYPHHKHVGNSVEPADAPDLTRVLNEIEQLLYAD